MRPIVWIQNSVSLIAGIFLCIVNVEAQSINQDSIKMKAPQTHAELSIGFNYDFLRPPLRVGFDYPKGFFSMNIPLPYEMPQSLVSSIPEDVTKQLENGEQFTPKISAKQNPNTSIIVDVPMLGGVATFSTMNMMYLRYSNTITEPRIRLNTPDTSSMYFSMGGMVSVPLDFLIGWETMTLGYAFKFNDNLKFGLNLHRHVFRFDLNGKVEADILGNFRIKLDDGTQISDKIQYSLHNTIEGHYSQTIWTPTIAFQLWRLSCTSRFGIDSKPKGFLNAKVVVPFFVDPNTFSVPSDIENYFKNIENVKRVLQSDKTNIEYSTQQSMTWKLPQAHTFMFDLIRDKLSLSYTKLFGNIEMGLYDRIYNTMATSDTGLKVDTLDFNFKSTVDHIAMLHGSFFYSFFNIGVFAVDFSINGEDRLLYNMPDLKDLRYGNGVLVPVLNFGTLFGSKIQILAEIDILPFTALKSGVVYYF